MLYRFFWLQNVVLAMFYDKHFVLLRKYFSEWGTAVAQWLRCCATNRKVAGSIPDGVSGNFR